MRRTDQQFTLRWAGLGLAGFGWVWLGVVGCGWIGLGVVGLDWIGLDEYGYMALLYRRAASGLRAPCRKLAQRAVRTAAAFLLPSAASAASVMWYRAATGGAQRRRRRRAPVELRGGGGVRLALAGSLAGSHAATHGASQGRGRGRGAGLLEAVYRYNTYFSCEHTAPAPQKKQKCGVVGGVTLQPSHVHQIYYYRRFFAFFFCARRAWVRC
ncbi:hypothetical protein EDC01DRAFT_481173 [Geopyxis carbonaria]|nr:hypothetical protein EDC01DRAFT_481173 [Geopyxis carbonaria]